MALAGIKLKLRKSRSVPNPQDLSAIAWLIGACSAGPFTNTTITTPTDLAQFGFGPLVEMAADVLATAGGPIYITRAVTSTPGTFGAVTKKFSGAAVGQTVHIGAIGVLSGLGAVGTPTSIGITNAGVTYTANQAGVTVIHLDPGTTTGATTVGVAAKIITVTLKYGGGVVTALADEVRAAVAASAPAMALLSAVANTGDGSGTMLAAASTPLPWGVGGVNYTANQSGVTVEHFNPGVTTASTLVTVTAKAIRVTLAHNGTNPISTADQVRAAVAASAPAMLLLSAVANSAGSGTGLAAVVAPVSLVWGQGGVAYAAKVPYATVQHINPGTNTGATTVAVTGAGTVGSPYLIAVTLKYGGGAITATADQVRAAVAASTAAMAILSSVLDSGDGTGLASSAAATVLPFGSNGTVTITGVPVDGFNFHLVITRDGTIGVSPAPLFQWSADNEDSYSNAILIQAGGNVSLTDFNLATGITVQFTGTFAAGDEFVFDTTVPNVTQSDMLAAVDTVLADSGRKFGFLSSPHTVTLNELTLINTKLQLAWPKKFIRGFFQVRDQDYAGSETEDQWMDSLVNEYLGFVSQKGILSMVAGFGKHLSSYTLRTYHRPWTFAVASRRALSAIHQDLGETAMGAVDRWLSITHDEYKKQGLDAQRFITSRTYEGRINQYWITGSPTLADPQDADYAKVPYVSTVLQVARIANDIAFPLLLKPIRVITEAENALIPPGAIDSAEAANIAGKLEGPIKAFLFKTKTDDQVSASLNPKDVPLVRVLRNYSLAETRELRIEINIKPLGYAETISIEIGISAN